MSADGYLGRMHVTPVSVIITFASGERYEPPAPRTAETASGRWILSQAGHFMGDFATEEEAASERDALAAALAADPILGYWGAMYEERTRGDDICVELPHGPRANAGNTLTTPW